MKKQINKYDYLNKNNYCSTCVSFIHVPCFLIYILFYFSLFEYLCMRLPFIPWSIVGVPSSQALLGFLITEIGSVRLLAPQHEATGGRVRIGLCPAEHTVWFHVRASCASVMVTALTIGLREGWVERTRSRISGPAPGCLTERIPRS